ncbi:EF-hand domain-containing protein [Cinnamomum micranthum f. kanehirae]|uniref:EF-hand domain-containing protein n=1 Tax=Cinnamomum micranthum f. kanehirae TaxID=337451 RepID=A0A3S3N5N3_9MAGN|nr:EF-hand domain-containing protein [Cinnamomum micranthum f. kanehirae]
MGKATFSLLIILLLARHAQSLLISDGIQNVHQPSFLQLNRPSSSSSDTCEQTYGFLPCTTTILGNLFLMLVYGYLMLRAAICLSTGSELLLNILGAGVIGGFLLPVLGAFPDALLILVSGLSGSKETAQNQVSIGMGLLAGSTVMLLTWLWGSCVAVGKCDLSEDSIALDSQDSKRCSLTGSGVTTDLPTSYSARLMLISVIPFFIVQLQTFFKSSSGKRIAILVSLVISIAFLLSYCLYQVFQTWIQERRREYAKLKLVMSGIIRSYISPAELRALIVGIEFHGINLNADDAVTMVMRDFDTSRDNQISKDEFITGLSKWLTVAKDSVPNPSSFSGKLANDFTEIAMGEYDMLIAKSDDVVENVPLVWFQSVSLLLLGTVIAAAFADPLIDAVENFSSATSIPSFFVSFIAMPLATNSSEAVSAIIFAHRKQKTTASLTFSEIYGSATMNNTLCLAVFLALVYFRHLTWDFSAEVLVILIVCIVMGLFASFRTTFQLWTCFVAFLLYPLSLALVYVLDYCFGWS